ncbi:hypothetical protein ZEAMMB73_Zm00001d038720 [Zea mays]|uniref:Uncharacterized protein n=1 Tax=Zea mays TaxID=4577 RepID=A0A1D6MA11_MAIZE|nr:hypothetical protein ZEAMMB73_Zm00001d038720 [Zea mays]AQK87631.1 hypothetical protein ZEAMMB73_Zm00001d038720 [Zea mays]
MDLENADLRMMRVMEAYQVKEFHPDVCKDPEIADLRMSERWRSIRECSSLLSIVKHVLQYPLPTSSCICCLLDSLKHRVWRKHNIYRMDYDLLVHVLHIDLSF